MINTLAGIKLIETPSIPTEKQIKYLLRRNKRGPATSQRVIRRIERVYMVSGSMVLSPEAAAKLRRNLG